MAAPQAPLGEHGAVGGEHGDVGRPVVERGEQRVRHPGDEIDHRAAEHDRAPDAGEHAEAQGLEEVGMALGRALEAPQPALRRFAGAASDGGLRRAPNSGATRRRPLP